MALTGAYVQSEEHECDLCKVRMPVLGDRYVLASLPEGWQRIRHAVRIAGCSEITEKTYEFCLNCATAVKDGLLRMQIDSGI
jgi:hypothetical protein